jgi:glycosyltransferase involved in cell wall biosynthesis
MQPIEDRMKQTTTPQPLTILQIASGCPAWGGMELHILNLSQQLTLRGHSVTVACRPDGWVSRNAKEMGLATLGATVLRQQDWKDRKIFAQFCTDNRVDVVHSHWSTDSFVPPFAARFAGVPVRMMTRHSPYPFKTHLGRLLYTRFLYTRILTVSQSVANTLIKCGVEPDKISVVHHGTNVAEFENVTKSREESRAEIGLTPDLVAVGILGRIAEEKGHRYLYNALKLLPELSNLRIVVVGEGPQAKEQRAYVTQNGLDDRVIWVPFRSDVNNVINALDIVAVPSTWEEPCSAVIQQAMALSKPVIGTRVGGTPEMVVHGVTGLLADAKDAGQLAGAIKALACDAEMRAIQGDAGAKRVRELFTLDRMTTRIEELYRQELSRSGRQHERQADPARRGRQIEAV